MAEHKKSDDGRTEHEILLVKTVKELQEYKKESERRINRLELEISLQKLKKN